jgi:hypothetical protein
MLVALVVGLLALGVAPGVALAAHPREGPAWWTECGTELEPHETCTKISVFAEVHVEVSSLVGGNATFVAYVKPIAGAPVTHWQIWLAGPYCPGLTGHCALADGEERRGEVDALGKEELQAKIADGEIVGGNPQEYVTVTGATSTALEPLETPWRETMEGLSRWVFEPLELLPNREYEIGITASEKTWEEDPTGAHQTWGTETIHLLTASTEPTIGAKARREKLKQEREAKKRKQAEERKRKREERKHRG